MSTSKYHSILDTERFGFNIAKINSFEEPVKNIINGFSVWIGECSTRNFLKG